MALLEHIRLFFDLRRHQPLYVSRRMLSQGIKAYLHSVSLWSSLHTSSLAKTLQRLNGQHYCPFTIAHSYPAVVLLHVVLLDAAQPPCCQT
jgi:hypothetical protein